MSRAEHTSTASEGHAPPWGTLSDVEIAALAGRATVHGLFEEQVARAPDDVAVVFEGSSLTFRELDRRANQVARLLRARGVGPEALVGVRMERSLDLMVGLLGILKAGGAYVPIDPAYPADRGRFMIGDSDVRAILTQEHLRDSLPDRERETIVLDAVPCPFEQESTGKPEELAGARNLAYVIYTSGSTGQPKGAMNEHRSIINRLLWQQTVRPLQRGDSVLQKTTFSFDVSVWELFLPLIAGARLVMARPGGQQDPDYLIRTICEENITLAHFVPSMLRVFLETPGVTNCTCIQHVMCSGEALPADLVERCHALLPATVHNLYGPTEAAVEVSYWKCARDWTGNSIPIGRPTANTTLPVLDEQLRPVPIGESGELHIGGIQVCRGYHRRPELTRERFIPDPFNPEDGARLYKTGDLARVREDGAIEYLGRLDHQVKVRGYRIELGEIETVLNRHPRVRETAVVVDKNAPGAQSLAAYLVFDDGPAPTVRELREHLGAFLPDYMVPSSFLGIERMPHILSGKIDRAALARVKANAVAPHSFFAAPQTPTEVALAALWQDVLRLDRVGLDDAFIELGGHSLLAVRIASTIREQWNVELSFADVLLAATVRTLAAKIESALGETSMRTESGLLRAGRGGPLPLSGTQRDILLESLRDPDAPAYNEPATIHFGGPVDPGLLERALNEIIRRHEILRTTYEIDGEEPAQIIQPHAALALPVVDLRELPAAARAEATETRASAECARPFDLRAAPLLRALLMIHSDADWRLCLIVHHIAADAVTSVDLLVSELRELYDAYRRGDSPSLPENVYQYADYAQWQRTKEHEDRITQQLDFWRSRLAGARPLELRSDRPRPPVFSYRGARTCFALSHELSARLRRLSKARNVTAFVTLLSAFLVLMRRHTGEDDVVIGSVSAGRDHPQTARMFGCFLNYLVLRADLSGDPGFDELLRRVRATVLEAVAHPDVSLSRLAGELRPARTTDRHPFYQIMFLMEPQSAESPGSWKVSQTEFHSGATKLDLTFGLDECDGVFIGRVEYSTDLFDAETVDNLIDQYREVLEGVVAEPCGRISAIPLGRDAPAPEQAATSPAGTDAGSDASSAPRRSRDSEDAQSPSLADDPAAGVVSAIWSDVLGTKTFHPQLSFFELGGHSLQAIRLLARVRTALRVEIPLPAFLRRATFAALLERVREQRSGEQAAHTLQTTPRTGPLPLSSGQRQLWYLHRVDPDGTGHNVISVLIIEGALDKGALARSVAAVVARHEALRTTFALVEGEPVQIVRPVGEPAAPCLSVEEAPVYPDVGDTVGRALEEENRRRFDLETGPLFSARLIPAEANRHALILNLHHIIADEPSGEILFRDLAEAYRSATASPGAPIALPSLALHSADFAAWEQSPERAARHTLLLDWWKGTLKGAPPVLNLPTDRRRPVGHRFQGRRVFQVIEPEIAAQIESLARTSSATPFMVFLAAWSSFLGRLCRESDVVVGVPVSLRSLAPLGDAVGFFINTLPFRIDAGSVATFRELVSRARDTALDVYARSDTPFDKLVEALHPDRTPGVPPVYQAMLVMRGAPTAAPVMPGLSTTVVDHHPESAKVDLTLLVGERNGSYDLALEYRSDLFDAETAGAWLEDFVTYVTGLVRGPETDFRQTGCISVREQERQLKAARCDPDTPPRESTMCTLVAEQARRSGERPAILVEGRCAMTHAQLDRAAAVIATAVHKRLTTPEPLVGVCFDRSPGLIAAMLGVMRAGAGYVPLDPAWPAARLRWMIDDAGVELILAGNGGPAAAVVAALGAGTNGHHAIDVLGIDSQDPVAGMPSTPMEGIAADPRGIAYVLYTSGSSGQPKGVEIEHRQLVASTLSRPAVYGARPERFLLLSPAAFDSSVAGIYWTLTTGGALVLPPAGAERDPRALARIIVDEKITHYLCLPSLHALLLDELAGRPHCLSTAIVAGEPCPETLPAAHRVALPGVRLFNEYGPTEGTVWCTAADITHVSGETGVPIGPPIPTARVYVADENLRLVPRGAAGEIVIAGYGLARGYHNRPGLTAERFSQGPFTDIPEARIYRTGDLGHWRSDGALGFAGRLDDQVKVRGYRIEPREIEAALDQHPAVKESSVVASTHSSAGAALVAYVSTNERPANLASDLREFLRARLPEYMVPSLFVVMDDLPRNRNGKIDRAALPAPESSLDRNGKRPDPPRSELEARLLSVWESVLGLQGIGIRDDFFELGGHSLLAVKLAAEIERSTGRPMPLASVIFARTIEQTARLLNTSPNGRREAGPQDLRGAGNGTTLFNIPGYGGVGVMPGALARAVERDRRYFDGLLLPGVDGATPPLDRAEEIAGELIRQIRRVQPHGPYSLTGFCLGGLFAWEVAQQLAAAGEDVRGLALWHTFPSHLWHTRGRVHRVAEAMRRTTLGPSGTRRESLVRYAAYFSSRARAHAVCALTPFRAKPARNETPSADQANWHAIQMRIASEYRMAPFSGPVLVVRGTTLPPDLSLTYALTPLWGWENLAKGPFEMRDFSCDHMDLIREPVLSNITSHTAAWLRAIDADCEGRGQH